MKLSLRLLRPEHLKSFHGWCIPIWAALWLAAYLFGFINSVAFVAHVTMATALLTSFSNWQSSRVEVQVTEEGT